MDPSITRDKSVGCILGVFVADAIGVAVEGSSRSEIRSKFPDGLCEYVAAPHMGVEYLGPRRGMYSDDTNATLALADSLVRKKGLDPRDAAINAAHWSQHEPRRGCPASMQAIFRELLKGTPYTETGTLIFKDGSFANGGAMKISPIGIAFRSASDVELRFAVSQAILSTHVHEEAVDGAFIQAKAVQILMNTVDPSAFDPVIFLDTLIGLCRTRALREKLETLKLFLDLHAGGERVNDAEVLDSAGLLGFQIKAIEAVPTALWGFLKYWRTPEKVIVNTIGFGGDTDTTASMAGALCGALHGRSWIPKRWLDEAENGEYGRDFAIALATKLAELDLHEVIVPR